MKIKKVASSYNTYSVELGWGQLNLVYRALEPNHADPMADELFAELGWFLQNVPGPGEDEAEYKEAKKAEKDAMNAGEGGGDAQRNQDLLGDEVEAPYERGEVPEGEKGPVHGQQPEQPPAHKDREEADDLLERPPQR